MSGLLHPDFSSFFRALFASLSLEHYLGGRFFYRLVIILVRENTAHLGCVLLGYFACAKFALPFSIRLGCTHVISLPSNAQIRPLYET